MLKKLKLPITNLLNCINMSINPEIKKMCKWIEHQKSNYINSTHIMKNPKFRKEWELFMEKYDKYISDNDKIWNDYLKKSGEYIEKYKELKENLTKEYVEKN